MKYDKLELIKKITTYYCDKKCLLGVKGECMGTVCPLFEILEVVDDELLTIGDEWIDAFLEEPEDDEED